MVQWRLRKFIVLLFLMAIAPAHSIETNPEKSIVLVKAFKADRKSRIEELVFKNMDSDKKFVVNTYGRHALEVTPGKYFLSRIIYAAGTRPPVHPLRISRPSDNIGTIIVMKGAITYIGDWGVSIDLGVNPRIYDWNVSYDLDSLKKFSNKYPELLEQKLNISNDMGAIYQVDWNSIVE